MVLQHIEYIILPLILLINLFIIRGDLKNNVIKNKFLGLLLCVFFIQLIMYKLGGEQSLYFQEYSFISIFGIFIASFLLSTFRVWGAGDAKYFFILYIFLGHISPLIYIANIVIATFVLLLYLFIKNLIFTNQNGIWLGYIIIGDFKRWKHNAINKFQESYTLGFIWLLNIINEFFLFFLFIKTIREIFFIVSLGENISWISNYINPYFILLAGFIIIVIFLRKYLILLRDFFGKKFGISKIESTSLFNLLLFVLISLLLFSIYKGSNIFLSEMYKILTIYFFIHILIRSIFYIYKKCFIEMEKSIIHVNDLKLGDYIDKTWMKGRITPLLQDKKVKIKQNISHYTQSTNEIREIQRLVKQYYRKEPYISIINSFPYSPVIFIAFLLTYINQSSYLTVIIGYIKF